MLVRFYLLSKECSIYTSPYCWKDRCCPDVDTTDSGFYPYCKLENIILPDDNLGCRIEEGNDYSTCPDAWHFDCCLCDNDQCDSGGYDVGCAVVN